MGSRGVQWSLVRSTEQHLEYRARKLKLQIRRRQKELNKVLGRLARARTMVSGHRNDAASRRRDQ